MPRRKDNPYVPHDWAPHEKPAILGSPSTPIHSTPKRIAYGIVGLLVCLTGALGNAVSAAIGGDIHNLPMTPDAVLAALAR